jgi:hypothetical protein
MGTQRPAHARNLFAVTLGFVVGSVAALLGSTRADAFTLIDSLNNTPRRVVSYCVESTPSGVSITQARVLLDNAIAHWEASGGIDGNPAVDPTHHNPCQTGTNVRIRASNISALAQVTPPGNTEIVFDSSGPAWWDGIGTRLSTEWCYECILVHEMGHSFGIGHAGGTKWSYDGFLPSMAQCGSQADAAVLDTIQQDDWGSAAYIAGGSTGKTPFWNANPGFERDFSHWARSSTTSVTVGSAYAETGSRGVRMAASGNWVYMTSLYDPYHPIDYAVTNMDVSTAQLHVRTGYRHPSSGTTGGVKVQYDTRFLRYDVGMSCKRNADATATHTAWSGVTDLLSCGDQGTTWKPCDGVVGIDNSLTNPATVFRAYVRSTSSSYVYIDRAGAYGGTTP